jgi:hypothetical protein
MKDFFYWVFLILIIPLVFLYGVYVGTVNNNYIHTHKTILINLKTLSINYIKKLFVEIDKLEIVLSNKQLEKLNNQKNKYIEKRVLIKDSVTWVKPEIKISNIKYKGKLKLKGLFLDKHERYEKNFSYSIKIKDTTFQNMSGFYLHYPQKRHNLFEWYGDNILKKTGLIYHKNDFLELSINKTNCGLYLVEEHTNKKLLIRNNRLIGPIIYFSKKGLRHDRYFETIIDHPKANEENFINAEILAKYPHKMNTRAKELMNGYLSGKIPPEKVFNFSKTATIFAISEMVGYIHQLQYHNVKFYYNPIEDRLEPIANDFQFHQLSNWTNELIALDLFKKQNKHIVLHWSENLFKSQKFIETVIKKLRVFATEKFINSFFQEIKNEEDYAQQCMSRFDPIYFPDIKFILNKNIKHINYILRSHSNLQVSISDSTKLFYSTKCCIPLKPISISFANKTYFTFPDSLYLKTKPFLTQPVNDSLLIKMPSWDQSEFVFNYKLLGDSTTYRKKIKSKK